MTEQKTEVDVIAQVRALAEGPGMIALCPDHSHGADAVIRADCEWCAAYGVDQDWREKLLVILNGGYPEFLAIPPGQEHSHG